MKITKVSGLSGYNFGDKMLSICSEKLLEYQNYEVLSFNINPIGNRGHKIKQNELSENRFKRKLKMRIRRFFIFMYARNIIRTLSNIKYYRKLSKSSNYLYYGGGNLISNANGSNYLFICFLLAFFTKKNHLVIFFCGVGPFSFFYRKQLEYIYSKSKYVIVRDNYSASFFKNTDKIRLLPDPAILSSYFFPQKIELEKKYFIVNLIDYSSFNMRLYNRISPKLVCDNVNKLSEMTCLTPVFISTSVSDNAYITECHNHYNSNYTSKPSILLIPEQMEDFINIIKNTSFSVVNRMHCGILSMSYGIPTVFFSWQKKVNGFIEHITNNEVSDFLYEDINMNSEEIYSKVTRIKNKYNLEDNIAELSKQLLIFKY